MSKGHGESNFNALMLSVYKLDPKVTKRNSAPKKSIKLKNPPEKKNMRVAFEWYFKFRFKNGKKALDNIRIKDNAISTNLLAAVKYPTITGVENSPKRKIELLLYNVGATVEIKTLKSLFSLEIIG